MLAQGLNLASPGQVFGQDFGQTEQQKQQRGRKRQRGRARWVKPWAGPWSSPWENYHNFPKGFPKIPLYEPPAPSSDSLPMSGGCRPHVGPEWNQGRSPLLFLLFCLTKILTKKLTWAGLGQALGWARVKPLGKLPQFSQGPPKMLKNGAPGIFLASWN